MLDIRFVREHPDEVKENIKKKFQDAKLPRKLTRVNLIPQELDPEPRKRARFPRKFSSSTDAWKAPRKPEDPFFSRPYVPGRSSGKKPAPQNFSRSVSGEKREVAVLLGGTGRRN